MSTPGSRLEIAVLTPSLPRRASRACLIIVGTVLAAACRPDRPHQVPELLRGAFVDDYGTHHRIDDSLWIHGTANRYRVIAWDATARFLIARNDSTNVADAGRYDRIDWLALPGVDGWSWAFCIVSWDAPSEAAARTTVAADTANPRTGCGGHPFTRMRRASTATETEDSHDRR